MLTILRKIIQEVSGAEDFQAALSIMVKRIAVALGADACSIFLLDRRHADYVLVATQGLNEEVVGKVRVPVDKGLISVVGEKEEPVNIEDATKHPNFYHVKELREEPYKAFLGTPIIYQRHLLGVLIAQQAAKRRYDESEEAFLVTLGTQLAAIIAHAEATGAIANLFDRSEGDYEATFIGIAGAPGIGIGQGVVVFPAEDLNAIPDREPDDIPTEITLLENALDAAKEEMKLLNERLRPLLPADERLLFDAYQSILDKSNLGLEIINEIKKGNWAQGALRVVIENHVERLSGLESEYLRERAADIRDLGHRVLLQLQRLHRTKPHYHARTILIGEELTATDLAEVPDGHLAGIISARGSSNSHIAILARAMDVPTVMGVSDISIDELQDKEIIVDGYYGQIYVCPRASLREEYEHLAKEQKQLDASLEVLRDQPAQTTDGHRILLMVNTGLGIDVGLSLAAGADGVGLYRTEIPFQIRERFPSGEEQRIIYRQLLSSFAPLPVIMRTLDVGGDKILPYFPVKEDNPFLGWRGLRVTLDHPDIFLVQVRAMIRASEGLNNLRIMLPMVTEVSEVDEALRLLKKAFAEVLEEGHRVEMPQVGVMIEVPSAVYQARSLAKRVDFLSVGTNDLTQYILAVDRNNPRVANLFDSMHPAVLRALVQVVESGHQEGKHVSICGEMASDPAAVPLLVALGFDSLSMNASSLRRIKWVVKQFSHKKAAKLLQEVLSMESAVMIRCHMELALERMGLGNLIRAGR